MASVAHSAGTANTNVTANPNVRLTPTTMGMNVMRPMGRSSSRNAVRRHVRKDTKGAKSCLITERGDGMT